MSINFLLEMEADKNAKINVYGAEFDALALIKSSVHPFEAGIGEEMIALFCKE